MSCDCMSCDVAVQVVFAPAESMDLFSACLEGEEEESSTDSDEEEDVLAARVFGTVSIILYTPSKFVVWV